MAFAEPAANLTNSCAISKPIPMVSKALCLSALPNLVHNTENKATRLYMCDKAEEHKKDVTVGSEYTRRIVFNSKEKNS
jgi:hypothetical protein